MASRRNSAAKGRFRPAGALSRGTRNRPGAAWSKKTSDILAANNSEQYPSAATRGYQYHPGKGETPDDRKSLGFLKSHNRTTGHEQRSRFYRRRLTAARCCGSSVNPARQKVLRDQRAQDSRSDRSATRRQDDHSQRQVSPKLQTPRHPGTGDQSSQRSTWTHVPAMPEPGARKHQRPTHGLPPRAGPSMPGAKRRQRR